MDNARLNEDLHATAQSENEMKCRLLLDVVVRESAAVLKLLAGKDKALLVWGDALLILDLGFDVINGVRGLDLKSDGLSGQTDRTEDMSVHSNDYSGRRIATHVLTKICMPPRRRRTKCRVDSFWML